MQDNVRVSIIMPCFNVADTLCRAIDSILIQRVEFEYEIIVVDDKSTDTTVEVVKQYQEKHSNIMLIQNEENKGNAFSFSRGLSASKGDYFCVLDGDDYYTIPDKLQRQVTFLDDDKNEEYVATAHSFVVDLGDGEVFVADRTSIKEFHYADFLTQNSGYYHTATYLYRNIFRGNVPEYFQNILYRGDTPRTTFHLMYSNKKIKVMDFVGSAYTFLNKGIWSALKEKEQHEYQINYQTKHRLNVTTDFERQACDRIIAYYQSSLQSASKDVRRYAAIPIDQCLEHIQAHTKQFAFHQNITMKAAYYSDFVDSLCASLGYISCVYAPQNKQTSTKADSIAIVNAVLNPQGGGIFREIVELMQIYRDKHIYLFVTGMDNIPKEVYNALPKDLNITLICPPKGCEDKLAFLQKSMADAAPYKAYYYASHTDVYGAAMMQQGICRNVCLFSFDHGYLCGISNPNIDVLVAKRAVDYYLLRKKFGERVIYIPTWDGKACCYHDLEYIPFWEHTSLVTASGAARYYKVDGNEPYSYLENILALLKSTGGKHYHFGNIPKDKKQYIQQRLTDCGLSQESFIHIEWSNDLAHDLLKNKVDVFIEPFPVVSYKMTLEVMRAGIPIIAFYGFRRMEITDFLYPGAMFWHTQKDFIHQLSSVTVQDLIDQSQAAKQYYQSNHSEQVIATYIRNDEEFSVPDFKPFTDNSLCDVTDCLRFFGNGYRISPMKGPSSVAAPTRPTAFSKQKSVVTKTTDCAQNTPAAQPTELKQDHCETNLEDNMVYGRAMALRHSVSFRVGYAVMWLPRSIKYFLTRSKDIGVRNTWKEMRTTPYLEEKSTDWLVVMQNLQSSKTYRVGRVLTFPLRKLRDGAYAIKNHCKKKNSKEQLNEKIDTVISIVNHLEDRVAQLVTLQKQQSMADNCNTRLEAMRRQLEEIGHKVNHIDDVEQGLVHQTKKLDDMTRQLSKEQEQQNSILSEVRRGTQVSKEILWAEVYGSTIENSSWLRDKSFSPGRWAIGYPFMYVLYRALEQAKPQCILEFGLGESTHMLTQYTATSETIRHTVIEQNAKWVDFYLERKKLATNTNVVVLPCAMIPFRDALQVRAYQGLTTIVQDTKYDLICVDAPSAEGMNLYSRIDVLSLIPDNLAKTFVLLLDDCQRTAEANTAKEISQALKGAGVEFVEGEYIGEKRFHLWCSPDKAFLCSL